MNVLVTQANAFTANSSGGNPAGVVLEAVNLTTDQMQDIAKRATFSETAFVMDSSAATKKVRFFTPLEEVDLCGHATIALWSLMLQKGLLPPGTYTQDTKAGVLSIDISADCRVFMEQTKAAFYDHIDSEGVAQALGISPESLHAHLKPQIVSTGLKDLLVPVRDEATLQNLKPDFDLITQMCKEYEMVGFHVFALLENQASTAVARNFAPLYGIDEESATGTSNGALLCYLKNDGILAERSEYRIEQGEVMDSPSHIYGKFKGSSVWIGGSASLVDELVIEL